MSTSMNNTPCSLTHPMQCGAKTRSGVPCRTRPMANGKCRMHGGKSLAGPASGTWVDGRHSKILPKRLIDDYHAGRCDPDKLALEDELALLDARINDLLSRVDSGESGQLWKDLAKAVAAFEGAKRAGDRVGVVTATQAMVGLVKHGHDDAAAWQDVVGLIERRRRLVESERKRLVEAQQMIGADQALAMMGILVESVRQHVTDPAALRAVVDTFARLTGRPIPTAEPPLPAGMKGRPRWNA